MHNFDLNQVRNQFTFLLDKPPRRYVAFLYQNRPFLKILGGKYDWRIGVLNNKAIFSCQYFMTKGHRQIYNHSSGEAESGGFATLPIHQVPAQVLKTALKATKLIGDGLYGVDLKQSGDRVVVIEVNDNPNIDSEVEDLYSKEGLYLQVMGEFLRRMELRSSGHG